MKDIKLSEDVHTILLKTKIELKQNNLSDTIMSILNGNVGLCIICKKIFIKNIPTKKFCCKECYIKDKQIIKEKHTQYNKNLRYKKIKDNEIKNIFGCEICGYKENLDILELHHKIQREEGKGRIYNYNYQMNMICENSKRNDLNNLMVLCPNCHKKETINKIKQKLNYINKDKNLKSICPFCFYENLVNKSQERKRCSKCGKPYYIKG